MDLWDEGLSWGGWIVGPPAGLDRSDLDPGELVGDCAA